MRFFRSVLDLKIVWAVDFVNVQLRFAVPGYEQISL